MKLKYFLLALIVSVLSACGGATTPPADTPATEAEEKTEVVAETTVESDASLPTEEAEEDATEEAEEAASAEESAAEEPTAQPTLDFSDEDIITTDSGLQYFVIEEGQGETPQVGDIVQVHYTGVLVDGVQFDSSYDRGEPFQFPLGVGQVIPGWDEGIRLMKVGSKYKLIIPPELAYGERDAGLIPPNSTLYFDVELVDIQPGAPAAPMEVDEADYVETNSGLKYYDIEAGQGDPPLEGERVTVHFTVWFEDGKLLDSSIFQGEPFTFPVGVGQVMPGWDEGMVSMKVGGQRQLVIPPELAYGEEGFRNVIPPNAILILEVELLDIQPGPPAAPTEVDEADYVETDSGLKYYDMEEGDGDSPQEGQQVTVHYTGWLEDGTMFDSSLARGEPFTFLLGTGQVIPGWDEGVASMQVGGQRQLVIPADLAYGQEGAGGVIPPDATLIFEVELLEVE